MKIEVKDISKSFKKVDILKDISITFNSGTIYGLVGPNGSGKSVFLKIICGFYFPSKGSILFDGVNYTSTNNFPPDTRALIENPDFIPELTGLENLKLLASIQNKISEKEIIAAMETVNIVDAKDKKYEKYSLGMKQKLGLAQVIMEDPKILIFDEPLNGIEDSTAQKFRSYLIEEKKKGKIIIIASHIKEDIEYLCDSVYKFEDGKLEKYDEKKTRR